MESLCNASISICVCVSYIHVWSFMFVCFYIFFSVHWAIFFFLSENENDHMYCQNDFDFVIPDAMLKRTKQLNMYNQFA